MQIIQMEPDDWHFYCQLTGEKVFHDDGRPNAPTLRGGWCHAVRDEPIYLAEELKPLWQKYLAAQEAAEDLLDIIRVGLPRCRPREVDRRLKPRWGLNPTGAVDRRT